LETKTKPIRVLIAEDSPAYRELLVSIIQSTPDLQVVGTARNGAEAVRLTKRLKPDVITMDIHMPEMNGFEATRQIMAEIPRPIVMITASFSKNERDLSFDALKAGALTVLGKPTLYDPPEAYEYLISQIRLMSEVKVVRRWTQAQKQKPQPPLVGVPQSLKQKGKSKIELVAIASSTGGPSALATILTPLPADFPAPILVVQHITPGFGEGFATWLNGLTSLEVRLAQHGDAPQAGHVLIAPDDQHMALSSIGLILLNQAPPLNGIRPSADYLFRSAAQVHGSKAIGVILTGMGGDGAEGLQTMHKMGAHTIAQNKETCVVFGMPAVAIELGAVKQILSLENIAQALLNLV
jgi:two-component system chemotaxis response regulator CheB